MYVCLSEHAILAVRAIRSITKDTIVLSVRFAAILIIINTQMVAVALGPWASHSEDRAEP